jgi:SAM-dependent methyltransferase
VHHRGFGFHADDCAPGILRLLEGVRARDGLVVELGCGSGLLTRHLLDAGLRVIAPTASPAMLEVARDAEEIRELVLPDDPIPRADAIVSVGHAFSYLPDAPAVERALVAITGRFAPAACSRSICATSMGRGAGASKRRGVGVPALLDAKR